MCSTRSKEPHQVPPLENISPGPSHVHLVLCFHLRKSDNWALEWLLTATMPQLSKEV